MGLILPLILVGLLTALAIKIFKFFNANPSSCSANPFKEDSSTEVKPKVIDQKLRDAVLKQGFSQDKIPSELDAIVIGSGIGGLSTAAIMAKTGQKVLVLEQHDQAGGCCHTFIDKGYEFDVGIHYIGELKDSISRTYLNQITNGQLIWEPMDDVYDEVIFSEKDKTPRKYPVMWGKGKWENDLKKRFPHEAQNIDIFFRTMEEVSRGYDKSVLVKFLPLWLVSILHYTGLIQYIFSFYYWNAKTCKEVIWDIVKTQELRDILCYCFGDYGTVPSKAGFPMQTLLHTHFMKSGGYYPIGGASEIAFNIIPLIEAAGGRVLVRAEVTDIILSEGGQAVGVSVKKGSEHFNIYSPRIISDAGIYNTFQRLLPQNVAEKSRLWPLLQSLPHGVGTMSVFVGIDCPADKLDIIHKRNAWVFSHNDIDKLTLDYLALSREEALDADIPLIFISFPSTKDPEWEKRFPGKTTMALVTLQNFEWVSEWKNCRVMKRGDEYDVIKNTFGHKAVEQATKLFPSIKDHIDYISIGTPVSNCHYLGAPKGEIYGLDHTVQRFSAINNALLRPNTDIKGLYLTGQDVCSCGFTGAMYGGLLCASKVLKRNLMEDIAKLHRKIKNGHKNEEMNGHKKPEINGHKKEE